MAEASSKLLLARAQQLAEAVRAELAPGCERIEIAGSVRRRKPEVSDIELVCIPTPLNDLIGNPVSTVVAENLGRLARLERIKLLKNGDKYKQFLLVKAGVKVDLFLVSLETWGVQYLIRTGPSDFSKAFVTRREQGGKILPTGWRVENGRLWNEMGVAVATGDEEDVFRAVGMKWLEPWERR